eukprot:2625419-Rhodomonas_salina.2
MPIFAAPGAGIRTLTGAFKAELALFIAARSSALGCGIDIDKPLGVAGCTGPEKDRGADLLQASKAEQEEEPGLSEGQE